MSGITVETQFAMTAAGVDLSYHPVSDEREVGRLRHAAYELVPQCSVEPGVAFDDFKIGIADASVDHLDERFAWAPWNRRILHEFETVAKGESFHTCVRSASKEELVRYVPAADRAFDANKQAPALHQFLQLLPCGVKGRVCSIWQRRTSREYVRQRDVLAVQLGGDRGVACEEASAGYQQSVAPVRRAGEFHAGYRWIACPDLQRAATPLPTRFDQICHASGRCESQQRAIRGIRRISKMVATGHSRERPANTGKNANHGIVIAQAQIYAAHRTRRGLDGIPNCVCVLPPRAGHRIVR